MAYNKLKLKIMTPKAEAKELVVKMQPPHMTYKEFEHAKQCALICVDEMLNNYEDKYKYCKTKQYLEEVKK